MHMIVLHFTFFFSPNSSANIAFRLSAKQIHASPRTSDFGSRKSTGADDSPTTPQSLFPPSHLRKKPPTPIYAIYNTGNLIIRHSGGSVINSVRFACDFLFFSFG